VSPVPLASQAVSSAPNADRRQQALRLLSQREPPSRVALQQAGFVDLEEVAQAVASQWRLPRLLLGAVELAPELAKAVPRAIAERYRVVPVFDSGDEITLATADPSRIEVFDWMARELRHHLVLVVATHPELDSAFTRIYEPRGRSAAADAVTGELSPEAMREAVNVVDRLISGGVEMQASDIHIEASERETIARYRVDGVLRQVESLPIESHAAVISRMKILAQLDISERQVPQDGRIKVKLQGREIDLRVSVLPTFYGEKIVCRILDNSRACLPLSELDFDPDQLAVFDRLIRVPYGLLLVTGPTGSGKSTTLYGALNAVKSPEINVVSVEDPVEYQLPGINQVQINPKRGLTFAGALRSILRQDPNVILVGEIRDQETGVIAAEAALTGHLVLASMHTNDAASAITRLTEMGIEPYLVAPSLIGVIAQRLMRRICTACREEYRPDRRELEALGAEGLPEDILLSRGRGCAACKKTGYRGRTAIREILETTDALKQEIGRGATAEELRRQLAGTGFRSMRFQALKRLVAGVTTSQEVLRVTRG
jgi:type IV pilus assembly protein PilB